MVGSQDLLVVQVSDLHLDNDENRVAPWQVELSRALHDLGPDVIVVTGDLTEHGYRDASEFEGVAPLFAAWPRRPLLLPGNHDIGNRRGADRVTTERLRAWRSAFGSECFSHRQAGWRLVGVSSELIGAELPDEGATLRWLEAETDAAAAAGEPVALFLHGPPYIRQPDEHYNDHSDYWSPQGEARQQLLHLIRRPVVRLLAHGHCHWYCQTTLDGTPWVWCPAVRGIVDDARFPPGGEKIGFIAHRLHDDGVESRLVELAATPTWYGFGRPRLEIPGRATLTLGHVLMDFNGTLAKDGRLIPGVADRLAQLAQHIRLSVMTADTHGRASVEMAHLPLTWTRIATGADKAAEVKRLGGHHVVAIGNGVNDTAMLEAAALGIAVIGPEGAAASAISAADVVTTSILDALDLLLHPQRLRATLRT